MRIRNKENFVDFIKDRDYKTMVEIGTGTGEFAADILHRTMLDKLYCVDLWEDWGDIEPDGKCHYHEKNGAERLHEANFRLHGFEPRVEIIKSSSKDAHEQFEDGSLDVCCIDGDLRDTSFLGDLELWFPKVREGGLIFGFSYADDVDSGMYNLSKRQRHCGVKMANTKETIDFFCKKYEQKLELTTKGDKCWFIIKDPPPFVGEIPEGKIDLEIAIHCFRYQKRLSWMLSSILQQEGDIPNILISISHTDDDGDPTTAEVCEFFRKEGLNIKEVPVTQEQVKNRAIARNIQTKETTADWILYVDSDMVYDPHFFEHLQTQVKGKYANEKRCLGADRISLDIPFSTKYFEEDTRKYPCVIENVASLTSQWPVKWVTGRKTVPGNFQLANVQAIREKGGVYSTREGDVWRRTKSDRQFRCIMGRCGMDVLPQYHLNHDRGGPEIQR